MKTIKYTLGIIAMVVTFSSCTVEELELASAAGVIISGQTDTGSQTTDSTLQSTDASTQNITEIDPPVIPTKP